MDQENVGGTAGDSTRVDTPNDADGFCQRGPREPPDETPITYADARYTVDTVNCD